MARTRKFSDAQIIEAIRANKGGVYLAAKALGCTAPTIYNRVKASPKVAEALADEDGKVDDIAELVLLDSLVDEEDKNLRLRAAMYRLSTKGKHRGYSEKTEMELTEKGRKVIVEEVVDAGDTPNNPPA